MMQTRSSGKNFWKYVRNYLTIYLLRIRCLSSRTIDSYRQSIFIYCTFLKEHNRIAFSKITFMHVSRNLVIEFIQWLRGRNCGIATCNLRLSSLKSFLKYCADEDISLYAVYQDIKRIPQMKAPKVPVGYMSETALKAVLAQPDIKNRKGMRNRMIIILLYDTATRVQELVDLKLVDLHLNSKNPFVIVTGKGGKTRSIPLMTKTVTHLKEYLKRFHNSSDDLVNTPLFYSMRLGEPASLSTDAISVMLKNYGKLARKISHEVPERVHPHLIRHTRAMHLYRSGIPLSYIAEFLGHANVSTTEIYASADTEMLRKALEKADPGLVNEIPCWKDEDILKKLCGL